MQPNIDPNQFIMVPLWIVRYFNDYYTLITAGKTNTTIKKEEN